MRYRNKRNILLIVSVVLTIMLSGCIDYDQLVEDQFESDETKVDIVSLGDINDDGKEEKLEVDSTVLKLFSGTRIVEKFDLNQDFEYYSLKAYVVDIDNDDVKEIIALIESGQRTVYTVKILNQVDGGRFELYDFPEEIVSNESISGISANVSAKEDFIYVISKGNFSAEINASRIYGLSMCEKEDYEKAVETWNHIMNADFQGEVLGVSDIFVMHRTNDETLLEVHECVVGGDDAIIGYLVTEIEYNTNGDYSIGNIRFKERVDVMP